MVRGLEKFGKHFADFTDRYVLIGGTASALAMKELGNDFRATKDLDIVLCLEMLDIAFVKQFWEFVRQAGYNNRQKSTGKKLFYRFNKPRNADFPEMMELFSRVPDILHLKEEAHLAPLPIEDEISSLSAILLDDAYYDLIREHSKIVDGMTIASPECLIPLKAKAYLDLTERRGAGEALDFRHIKKHKNDIFRLYTILNPNVNPTIEPVVKIDLLKAFRLLEKETIQLQTLGIQDVSVAEILTEMEKFYGLGNEPSDLV